MKVVNIVVALFTVGASTQLAQAQIVKPREVYVSGTGSDRTMAIKAALTNAVAEVCGQRVVVSQNIENQTSSQSSYSKEGKVGSLDQSKKLNETINSLSDGVVEKYEVLSEVKWTAENVKVDVSAVIGKCFEQDPAAGQLVSNSDKTNNLLSKILKSLDDNSDQRGIKPTDNKWDVMAKEMWFANFAAYQRQGQFKDEEQAKFAIERGFYNRSQMNQQLDQEILLKIEAQNLSNKQKIELLNSLSSENFMHDTTLRKIWDEYKSSHKLSVEIFEKCGPNIRSSIFLWGSREFEWNEERRLQMSGGRPECKAEFPPAPTTFVSIGTPDSVRLKPICDEYALFSKASRTSAPLDTKIERVCAVINGDLPEKVTRADKDGLSSIQRLAIFAGSPDGNALADFFNIKYAKVLHTAQILETAQFSCVKTLRGNSEPIYLTRVMLIDRGMFKQTIGCEGALPFSFSARPADGSKNYERYTLVWRSLRVGEVELDAENDRATISENVESFCKAMRDLRLNLSDKGLLESRIFRGGANLNSAFELFCV